jgi:hypothetical protein
MNVRACLALGVLFVAGSARAERTNGLALEMSGVRYGSVHLKTTETAQLVMATQDVGPPLVALVGAFAQSKPLKKDIRLFSGAVVRKTNDARLASVKLPAVGSGGTPEIELAFTAGPLATQPVLSAKESPPLPSAPRITGFRVDVTGLAAIEAPKLDAITLTQKADGTVTTGDIVFEAAAGGAPPFTAWQKAHAARAAPRNLRLEYVGSDGKAVLELHLDRCTPSAVVPLGASGTTRITLVCANVHPG